MTSHYLLGKWQHHHCKSTLLGMRVKHVTQCFNSTSMGATVNFILGELKLIDKWLNELGLLDSFCCQMTVEQLIINIIV